MISPARPGNQKMFVFLLILSVSYWYCLPVITQSVLDYNEFRGYDLLLLGLSAILILRFRTELRNFLKQDKPGRYLFIFAGWATATFPVTIAVALFYNRPSWIMVTFIFLLHLWEFSLAYCAFRIFVRTARQCYLLLDVFLIVGAVEALIICLQGLHIVPRFWSELYNVYGDVASATLGPNRTLPGHAMVLVFCVAAGYIRNISAVGLKRAVLGATAATVSIPALLITGSRTAWATFAIFCVVAFILQRPQLKMVAFVLLLLSCLIWLAPQSIHRQVTATLDRRLTSPLERVSNQDATAQFQAVDAGRYDDWVYGLKDLADRPWLIPFGGGFNSYRFIMSRDVSAHNIYITLVAETGIVGLLLYLMWLKSIWNQSSRLISVADGIRAKRRIFLPLELRALLIALLVSLFAGELLYPYRPSFAFMGMFLFVCAVMNHPALVFGIKAQPAARSLVWRPQRKREVGISVRDRVST